MTERDVKNYLEKIYKVPVAHVKTVPRDAKIEKGHNGELVKKEDDYRMAYVQLPVGVNFEFPELFPEPKKKEEREDHDKAIKVQKKSEAETIQNYERSKNVPTWFL